MKWRPISELSDEQRDGRWWTFGMNVYTEIKQFEGPRFSGKDLEQYRYCKDKECWMDYNGSDIDSEYIRENYFLSEPLPDFPKPQKMEWRRLEEEWPLNFPIICRLLNRENILIEETYTFEANRKIISYWMPIVPPEDE